MEVIQILAFALLLTATHLGCVWFGARLVRTPPAREKAPKEQPQEQEFDSRQLKQYYNLLNFNGTREGQLSLDD